MDSPSRYIPLEVKRAVRQRCGFGCVLCGAPFYHYDHLDGWAVTRVHDPERIALLCAKHHDEKTRGMLPPSAVEQAAQHPVNQKAGHSSPQALHFAGDEVTIEVGSNRFISTLHDGGTIVPISVDGIPLVRFRREDDQLLLSVCTLDWFNVPSLIVDDNELTVSAEPYDVTWEGRRLRVHLSPEFLLVDMELRPPDAIVVSEGRFLCNGVWVQISPNGVRVANVDTTLARNDFRGRSAGIAIGELPEGVNSAGIHLPQVFRYSQDMAQSVGVAVRRAAGDAAG